MDHDRIDALARTFTETRSRRGFSRLLGALSLGGPLALLSQAETEARRKKKKKKKKKGTAPASTPSCVPQCTGKRCGPNGCGGSCGSCVGGTCPSGQCVCPAGTELCRGACIADTRCCIDEDCSNAGNQCLANGTCAKTCPVGNECQPGCACNQTPGNAQLCYDVREVTNDTGCTRTPCNTSADCEDGLACMFIICNGQRVNRCLTVCQ